MYAAFHIFLFLSVVTDMTWSTATKSGVCFLWLLLWYCGWFKCNDPTSCMIHWGRFLLTVLYLVVYLTTLSVSEAADPCDFSWHLSGGTGNAKNLNRSWLFARPSFETGTSRIHVCMTALKSTIHYFSLDMFGSRLLGKRTFVWADGPNIVAIKSKTVLNSSSFFTKAWWKHVSLCNVHFLDF